MYDQSKLVELIRFSRVDVGATVVDVYPGDGDWTRVFSDVVGTEGRVYSFVPAEVAHFKNDPVGLIRKLADHAAAAGVGTSNAQSLHRIDPATVREEVEAAGFVLDAESNVLANKDDPHSSKVFDPSIKGETDRFAYRFVKP